MLTYTIRRRYKDQGVREGKRYDDYMSGVVGYNEAMLQALNELQNGFFPFTSHYDQIQVYSVDMLARELLQATMYPPEEGE